MVNHPMASHWPSFAAQAQMDDCRRLATTLRCIDNPRQRQYILIKFLVTSKR